MKPNVNIRYQYIKRSSVTFPKMKLLGSVIVASTLAKSHNLEKSCVGQKCGCNSEEMIRWKNEMKNWEHDQASKFKNLKKNMFIKFP